MMEIGQSSGGSLTLSDSTFDDDKSVCVNIILTKLQNVTFSEHLCFDVAYKTKRYIKGGSGIECMYPLPMSSVHSPTLTGPVT